MVIADPSVEGLREVMSVSSITQHQQDAAPPPAMGGRKLDRYVRGASGQSSLRHVLIASDAAALLCAWALVPPTVGDAWLGLMALWLVTGLAVIAMQRLYRARVSASWTNETTRLIRGMTLLGLVWLALRDTSGAGVLATLQLVLVAAALLMGTRGIYRYVLRRLREGGGLATTVVVVGEPAEAAHLLDVIRETPEAGFTVVGVVGPHAGWAQFPYPWLGDLGDVADVVRRHEADGVLIETAGMSADTSSYLVHQLLEQGTRVQVSIGLRQFDHRRLTSRPIGHEPLMYLEPPTLSRLQRIAKRTLDVVGATIGLALSLPVLAAAAIAIKLEDGGPVLYRQTRVGRGGETFAIWKLRTMVVDAEGRLHEVRALNRRDGPLFKVAADPRVTRIGRLLRATSVDEIPQFWNVLRGEMSLVGPRPALPREVAAFDKELLRRLGVRPGITGMWQVEGRERPSFDTYRRLDLFYIRNWSIDLDLAILLATIGTVMLRMVRAVRRRAADSLPGAAEVLD